MRSCSLLCLKWKTSKHLIKLRYSESFLQGFITNMLTDKHLIFRMFRNEKSDLNILLEFSTVDKNRKVEKSSFPYFKTIQHCQVNTFNEHLCELVAKSTHCAIPN